MIYDKVFPLADTLQLSIDVYRKYTDNYELRGNRKFLLPLSKTSDLQLNIKIEASMVGDNETAILVHVSKDFWVYLVFDKSIDQNGVLTLYYLSFDKLNIKAIKTAVDGEDVETALMALRPAIKAQFSKGARDVTWNSVDMVQRINGAEKAFTQVAKG